MIAINLSEENLLKPLDAARPGCWIHMTNPVDNEVELVSRETGIPETMLKTALDEEESAHTDFEDGNTMIVVDIPFIDEEQDQYVYSTVPFGIVYNKKYFVTVCLKDTSLVYDFFNERVKNVDTRAHEMLMLQLLYRNATKFLQHLKQIDKTSHRVQAELHKSMKNKELILLLELEKSLVYFSTSLRANEVVIEKVMRFDGVRGKEDLVNYAEDLVVENKQANEMCNIYRDILSGTMDAFASIISNNVNIVMKLLTIITIVLSVPTLVFSLWGMNVKLPFGEGAPLYEVGFYIVLALTVVLTAVVAWVLVRRTRRLK